METLIDTLNNAIKTKAKFLDNNNEIIKESVKTSAVNLDPELLSILLGNSDLEKAFFKEVDGVKVFDSAKFLWMINGAEYLPNSYTSFKNKIGLGNNDNDFIKNIKDVVISFPYKDCVLLGGQDKEDMKRSEVFLNETICAKQIDSLLEPKVLLPQYKYENRECKKVSNFENDNLIIKGNNLIALASLLPRYEGKINLIFIDPPYNTANDTFKYNDSFNHSTWLTFMKNRLELARRLLAPNGSIYISIDYNEVHYLKVLMDEIFGRDCFQREIIWRIGWLSGYKTTAKNFIRNHDTILFYTKNPNDFVFNKKYLQRGIDFQERFMPQDIRTIKSKIEDTFTIVPQDFYDEFIPLIQTIGLPEQYPLEDTWNCSIYDKLNSIAVVSFSGEKVSKMLDVDEIKGQKAEKLLKRIIETATKEGDIVLDFFLGSGTTAAVAQKMNRKYIGIEQMDYVESTVCERLKKVINGEDNSGVTTDCNWNGGGSFVFCTIAEMNEHYVNQIKKASGNKLLDLYNEIVAQPLLLNYLGNEKYLVTPECKSEFLSLSEEDQKKILNDILDKNVLYLNYSEIDDQNWDIDDQTKSFNSSFYGK